MGQVVWFYWWWNHSKPLFEAPLALSRLVAWQLWLVATRVIEEDEEIYVDYNYDPEASTGPHWEWYRELREQHEASMQEGDL